MAIAVGLSRNSSFLSLRNHDLQDYLFSKNTMVFKTKNQTALGSFIFL